jgi:hypothetical protein
MDGDEFIQRCSDCGILCDRISDRNRQVHSLAARLDEERKATHPCR